jgi:SAM-dependent methyltransferase
MLNTKLNENDSYYNEIRYELADMVIGKPKRILEIGCASGQFLDLLKQRGAEYTVGIELSEGAAAKARLKSTIDKVIVGNIESMQTALELESFDLIVASHVLEHLVDPWVSLKKLCSFLKPGGQLLGALPNVRHISVISPLIIRKDWKYRDSGVLDWTHLRFFAYESVRDFLSIEELNQVKIVPDFAGPRAKFLNKVTINLLKDYLAYAYNFSAIKR